jgi:uncharacterized phosphosugar-binding protein
MTDYVQHYFSTVIDLLAVLGRESGAQIAQAAELVAEAIQNDHDFLLFGSGHSTLIAQDAAGRAGGLVPALALRDISDGEAERIEGIAEIILGYYKLIPGSVIIIISNSGINAVPVEMAELCKGAGLTVIAVTSVAHSKSVPARHSSGKKLYALADLVIDTHGVIGDAAIELPGSALKSGAVSTILGSAIVQAITVQAVVLLMEAGIEPPVWISANLPDTGDHNRDLVVRYRPRQARYDRPIPIKRQS